MGLASPFTAGAEITAASLAAAAPLAAYKYADQNSGQSNTALVNDTDLSLALLANGTYAGCGLIVFSASAVANYKCTLTAPAGVSTGGWSPNLYVGTAGTVITNNAFLAFAATAAMNCQGTAQNLSIAIQFTLVMGATAGNLQFQFAQNTSDATNINTRAGSFLLAWKIA